MSSSLPPQALHWLLALALAALVSIAHGVHAAQRQEQRTSVHSAAARQPIYSCPSMNRGVALTFDDGPSEWTHTLLDRLKELNVTATFFVTGYNTNQHPEVVKRAFDEGHEIGIHTLTHANLSHYWESDQDRVQQEVDDMAALIQRVTGRWPRLIRPPYGALNPGLLSMFNQRGWSTVMWTSGCIDWAYDNMDTEIPFMLNGLADSGSIMCMHDTSRSTCEDVDKLINMLRSGDAVTMNPQGRKILSWDECAP